MSNAVVENSKRRGNPTVELTQAWTGSRHSIQVRHLVAWREHETFMPVSDPRLWHPRKPGYRLDEKFTAILLRSKSQPEIWVTESYDEVSALIAAARS